MEWLLTLFAMLGAVTGAAGGVRAVEAPLHRAEAASAVQVAAAVAEQAVARTVAPYPAVAPESREVQPLPEAPRIAAIPLYADRRIE